MKKGDLLMPSIKPPKKHPCFGYLELESWGQETQRQLG